MRVGVMRRWMGAVTAAAALLAGSTMAAAAQPGDPVQKFAPIEESVVQHVRGGGDLALICHSEELITRGYEALVREAERDARFRTRVAEAARRVQKLKKSMLASPRFRKAPSPSPHKVERLSRALWEFGEEVRLAALGRSA